MESLGTRIKARRKEMGLTLRELAGRCGLSATFLCEIEGDKRGIGADSLLAVGNALGLPLDKLMRGAEGQVTAGVEVHLPAPLLRLASDSDMTVREALCLYWMQRTIMDHRPPPKRAPLDKVDWLRFYEAVKPFLA